jgi:hypothetical protein
MSEQRITLETAAFLDSPAARALAGVSRAETKFVVESFLGSVYDGLGKAPRLLEPEDFHELLGHVLPGRFARRDPRAARVPAVLRAYLAHLGETEVLPQAFELGQALEANLAEFERAVRTGDPHGHAHAAPPVRPIVNRAPKVGRNDPCPCGSGKKFKACCARLG